MAFWYMGTGYIVNMADMNWIEQKSKKEMTRVGFEPTPTNVDQETGNSY